MLSVAVSAGSGGYAGFQVSLACNYNTAAVNDGVWMQVSSSSGHFPVPSSVYWVPGVVVSSAWIPLQMSGVLYLVGSDNVLIKVAGTSGFNGGITQHTPFDVSTPSGLWVWGV